VVFCPSIFFVEKFEESIVLIKIGFLYFQEQMLYDLYGKDFQIEMIRNFIQHFFRCSIGFNKKNSYINVRLIYSNAYFKYDANVLLLVINTLVNIVFLSLVDRKYIFQYMMIKFIRQNIILSI